MPYEKELSLAAECAKKAGEYLLSHQKKVAISSFKGNASNYVTTQDLHSDAIITEMIHQAFPNDEILSEEGTHIPTDTKRLWVIDPLDGTRNYTHNLPYFSVSVALYEKGNAKVGVVYAPAYNGELYAAVRGGGATLNNQPLTMISPEQDLKSSVIATGFSYFKGNDLTQALKGYESILNECTDIVRFGSAALDICQVAAGRLGAYYERGLKPWDIAAALLILGEAGGCASDYGGRAMDIFHQREGKFSIEIVAAKNTSLQAQLIRNL